MSTRNRVLIKLTEDQRKEIIEKLGKEVTYLIFRLVGGSQILVDASDAPDIVNERC